MNPTPVLYLGYTYKIKFGQPSTLIKQFIIHDKIKNYLTRGTTEKKVQTPTFRA